MSRHNKTGRSKGGGQFVALYTFMLRTPAWRALKPAERAVYVEIAAIYNGKNNGFLGLSVRDAADRVNVNKDTVTKCLRQLVALGFVDCAQPGGFSTNARRATEWRLTHYRCDRTGQPATRAYQKWRPENAEPSPSIPDTRSPRLGQSDGHAVVSVPSLRTVGAA